MIEEVFFAILVASALGQHESPERLSRRPFTGPLPQPPASAAGGGVDTLQERAFLDAYDYDPVDEVPPPTFNSLRPGSRPRPAVGGLKPHKRPPTDIDCRSKSRTVPHEKYCDLYYHTTGCEDGQALLRSCPNGLLYTGNGRHGLIGVCDYPHNVHCGDKTKHNPPISTEHCDWLYGIFGHETSCTRYWTCWNGTATEQFCVGGLLYNEETHACDWPQNVGGCQKHPLCKDDANGNVPLGKSCNRYWACQGGYPRLQRCPAMLVFDKVRKRCVAPPTEDCDVPPTTNPPDTEQGQQGGGGGGGQDQRGGSGPRNNAENRRRLGNPDQGPPPNQFQLPEGATLIRRPNN